MLGQGTVDCLGDILLACTAVAANAKAEHLRVEQGSPGLRIFLLLREKRIADEDIRLIIYIHHWRMVGKREKRIADEDIRLFRAGCRADVGRQRRLGQLAPQLDTALVTRRAMAMVKSFLSATFRPRASHQRSSAVRPSTSEAVVITASPPVRAATSLARLLAPPM